MRIAILGAGKIGESLLAGLLSSGTREPREIVATGRRDERLDEIAERHGVRTTRSNAEAVGGAALVVTFALVAAWQKITPGSIAAAIRG